MALLNIFLANWKGYWNFSYLFGIQLTQILYFLWCTSIHDITHYAYLSATKIMITNVLGVKDRTNHIEQGVICEKKKFHINVVINTLLTMITMTY